MWERRRAAVIRTFSGEYDKKLVGMLEKHEPEIQKLIRSINGFVSYSLVRTADGGFSVSVYEEKADIDERARVARDWIARNAGTVGSVSPIFSEGTVVLQVTL